MFYISKPRPFYLRSHVGKGADQFPLLKHSLSNSPTNLNPSSHVWLTTDPKVVDSPVVFPFKGTPGSPQLTTGMGWYNQ